MLIAELDSIASGAEAIPSEGLSPTEHLTKQTLMVEAAAVAGHARSALQEFMVDPMLGPHMELVSYVPSLSPPTKEIADAYVARASRVGASFDGVIERLRAGVAKKRTPPRVNVKKVIAQLDAYLGRPTSEDPFMQISPAEEMDEAAVKGWRDSMHHQVVDVVRPAIARYRDAIATEVLPSARPQEKSGVCWLPGGEEIYARATKLYTSLDIDPEAVHQIGLDEIAALEDEYRATAATVLGTTDIDEIYQKLRSDQSLRFESADEVQAQAERALARAEEAAPQWFGRLPVTPCSVQPVPDVGAEDAPLAYDFPPAQDGSRPGIFFINLTKPTTRKIYESDALAFHESVPGHHFQIAIAQELEDLPTCRRNGQATAYIEGWGLYTERLADEMGLYSGDLERMGILSFDSWRAGRLVVDTGLHAKGWSRQQAIDYLTNNSPQASNNIENEVDRYIGYVGQAISYKLGQREIMRVREGAEARLGASFDIKDFHDALLGEGPLPLSVMTGMMDTWVDGVVG